MSDIYVLDADVFMQAKRQYYAFDIAPPFWVALVNQASSGRLLSIDRVKDDIERGKDDLTDWANGQFHNWFDSTDQDDVVEAYKKIINWVQNNSQFKDAAKAEFAGVSDGWVVAYAMAKRCVVVTMEESHPNAKARIPIPNVCQAFSIRYINTFEMLRELGVQFT